MNAHPKDTEPTPIPSAELVSTEPDIDMHVELVTSAFKENIHAPRLHEKIRQRSARITDIVQDFTLGKANQELIQVAKLYGIAEQLRSGDYTKKAVQALKEYRKDQDTWRSLNEHSDTQRIDERTYVVGILTDIRLIDDFLKKQRGAYNSRYKESKGTSNLLSIIHDSDPAFPMIDLHEIANLMASDEEAFPDCKGVQIESFLLMAAEAFDDLREAQKEDDDTRLRKAIFNIEAFFAPLCEIIGFDAFSMAMRSEVLKIRISQHDGPEGKRLLGVATEKLEQYDLETSRQLVDNLIEDLFGHAKSDAEKQTESVIKNEAMHGIAFGTGTFLGMGDARDGSTVLDKTTEVPFDYVWRVKTIGSLAKKLEKSGEPADIVGVTVITENVRDTAKIIGQLLPKVEDIELEHISGISSQNRQTPYSFAGDSEFIKAMADAMIDAKSTGSLEFDKRERTNGFEVAKITIQYTTVVDDGSGGLTEITAPVEIAVMTSEARRNARVGDAAHALKYLDLNESYLKTTDEKYKGFEETVLNTDALRHLHERRVSTDHVGLTRQGLVRALEEMRYIDAQPSTIVGRHAAAAAIAANRT